MSRIVVVANPVASQFTGGSHRDVMAELSESHDVEALWPGSAQDSIDVVTDAIADGAEIVVAMGGDGMVHHVSQALVGTGVALGIIPSGTTNVVAQLLKIPSKAAKAARLVARSQVPTTIGTVRLALRRGDIETVHHSLFACGFGLDAEVVRVADSDPYRKYRFGSLHYARSAVGVGMGRYASRRENMTVTANGQSADAATVLVQFREIYTYFGKIPLRVNARSPQPMTIMLMDRLRRRRVPGLALRALTHRPLDNTNGVDIWEQVEELSIEADPPVGVQADGEGLGQADGARVTWAAASLDVISGRSSD